MEVFTYMNLPATSGGVANLRMILVDQTRICLEMVKKLAVKIKIMGSCKMPSPVVFTDLLAGHHLVHHQEN